MRQSFRRRLERFRHSYIVKCKPATWIDLSEALAAKYNNIITCPIDRSSITKVCLNWVSESIQVQSVIVACLSIEH